MLLKNSGKKKPNLGESWADKNKNMWRISQLSCKNMNSNLIFLLSVNLVTM